MPKQRQLTKKELRAMPRVWLQLEDQCRRLGSGFRPVRVRKLTKTYAWVVAGSCPRSATVVRMKRKVFEHAARGAW